MQDEYIPDLVTLSDDEGKEYEFEVLDSMETESGLYYALSPVTDDENNGDLVIVRADEQAEETFFEEIEDDDEYETIAEAFISRLQDYYEIDEK